MKYLLLAIVVLHAAACAPSSKKKEASEVDIDSILSLQVRILGERKALLTKSSEGSAGRSDTSFVPTSTGWKEELEVFRVLGSFNQKLYQGTYQIEGPLEDPRSNLKIRRYTNDQAPLRSLLVFYRDDLSRIRQLTGVVEDANPLYSAHRELTLTFDELNGKPALTGYKVSGYQKLALRDTVRFEVTGVAQW